MRINSWQWQKQDILKWNHKHENSIKIYIFISTPSTRSLFQFFALLAVFSISSMFLRKPLWSRVLMLHQSHIKFTQLQNYETSAPWYAIMCRFWEDYCCSTVECITCPTGEIRAREREWQQGQESCGVLTVGFSFTLLSNLSLHSCCHDYSKS